MKVVILTSQQGNQIALCHKLGGYCEIAAIVVSRNSPRKARPLNRRLQAFAGRISVRALGSPFIKVWNQLLKNYQARYPTFPEVPIVRVENVNDAETLAAIAQHQPNLIVVSGTNLVGRKTMESAPQGTRFVNLHTGISPYVKGGPNCTNWCLAENTFNLIGNTVMWLDAGIDSGNIIATEQTPLDGSETLLDLHWKVMEHAHDLYGRVIQKFAAGHELPSVPQQNIDQGRTFYSSEWNGLVAHRALKNFRKHYRRQFLNGDQLSQAAPRLFPLEGD
jgi:methionyl-tRNA formyltransferase